MKGDAAAAERAADLDAYRRYRRRTVYSLFALVAALGVWGVFHQPERWADGHLATWVLAGARLATVAAAIAFVAWNGRTAELSGYYRGRYGSRPPPT